MKGSVINAGNGFGYDGAWYAAITKNFLEMVSNGELSLYRIQRILPSAAVKILMTLLQIPVEDYFIIKSFQFYNLVLLSASSVIWIKISELYNLSLKNIWFGFILGFINYGIFLMPFFYPVLTDITAFFLGFCLYYFYLRDNLIAKIIVTFLGAFTWPLLLFTGILLIIFPVTFRIKTENLQTGDHRSAKLIICLLSAVPFLIQALITLNQYFSGMKIKTIFTQPVKPLMYFSSVLNFFILVLFFYIILPGKISVVFSPVILKKIIKQFRLKDVISALAIILFTQLLYRILGNPAVESETDAGSIFYYMSVYSITKPLVYIVTSISYFGPVFMLCFILLKEYRIILLNSGIGIYITFIVSFLILLVTEARLITSFFPVILVLTVLVVKKLNFRRSLFVIISIFSLILSKIYIPMNNVPDLSSDRYSFTNQLYFMNTFMISKNSYYIQGILFLFMTVVFVFFYRKRNHNITNN
ncbi:MAG: hypothetical protein JNJ56_00025 [Ignavibacteria bacterium]|nr:hypothetical protein [Ignavibacteria bacterium]